MNCSLHLEPSYATTSLYHIFDLDEHILYRIVSATYSKPSSTVHVQNCFVHTQLTKACVDETSCNQLLLIDSAMYVQYIYQVQFASLKLSSFVDNPCCWSPSLLRCPSPPRCLVHSRHERHGGTGCDRGCCQLGEGGPQAGSGNWCQQSRIEE